jgi:hypothetical protein
VHAIADTGLKFNTLSHKSIEKLLKQQVATIDDLIDGSAQPPRDGRARQGRQGHGRGADLRRCRRPASMP